MVVELQKGPQGKIISNDSNPYIAPFGILSSWKLDEDASREMFKLFHYDPTSAESWR